MVLRKNTLNPNTVDQGKGAYWRKAKESTKITLPFWTLSSYFTVAYLMLEKKIGQPKTEKEVKQLGYPSSVNDLQDACFWSLQQVWLRKYLLLDITKDWNIEFIAKDQQCIASSNITLALILIIPMYFSAIPFWWWALMARKVCHHCCLLQ